MCSERVKRRPSYWWAVAVAEEKVFAALIVCMYRGKRMRRRERRTWTWGEEVTKVFDSYFIFMNFLKYLIFFKLIDYFKFI